MKLGLIQTKHGGLYRFLDPDFPFETAECLAMQQMQIEQNFALLRQTPGQGIDLLVTTECINYIRTHSYNSAEDRVFYPPLGGTLTTSLGAIAKAANAWLVAGCGFAESGGVYNGALVFDRSGTLRQVYRKTHLAGDEATVFAPGDALCIQQTEFGCFGVCICWDMQFPEVARTLALRGAQLVVCPTWGWEANLYGRARAYENGIFTAAAMAIPAWGSIEPPRTPSSVIGPDGRILACAPPDRASITVCEIDLEQADDYRATRLNARRAQLYL